MQRHTGSLQGFESTILLNFPQRHFGRDLGTTSGRVYYHFPTLYRPTWAHELLKCHT